MSDFLNVINMMLINFIILNLYWSKAGLHYVAALIQAILNLNVANVNKLHGNVLNVLKSCVFDLHVLLLPPLTSGYRVCLLYLERSHWVSVICDTRPLNVRRNSIC